MVNSSSTNKTRIAPTPSGFLHLGNAYSFLQTAAIAKEHHAILQLRIDDMDHGRYREEYVTDIFDTLHFLGIEWQEGPLDRDDFERNHSQYSKKTRYEEPIEYLRQMNRLYACTCSRTILKDKTHPCECSDKHISLDTPGVAWRILTDDSEILTIHQLDGGHLSSRLPVSMKNFIIRKKDGDPSYQLCSLIDDMDSGVNIIVRGEDLLPSSFAQLLLAKELGLHHFLDTKFHHHGLLKDESGKKLSKSAGSTSIKQLKEKGLKREAVIAAINLQV